MAVKIFLCYAHEDESLMKKLTIQLASMKRQGLIEMWHDRDINAGTEWAQEISEHLNAAQIVLLLVSPDFMNSDYCYSVEMQRALERHRRKEAYVMPIILRPVHWQEILGALQALPTDAIPVTSSKWHDLDEAFFDVAERIRRVAIDIKERNAFMATEAQSRKGPFDKLLNSPSEPSMANGEPSQSPVDVDTKPDTRPKLNHAQNILDTSVSASKPVQGSQVATLASSAQPQPVRQPNLDTHSSLNRKVKALVFIVALLLIIGVGLYAIVSSSEANNRQPLHLQTTPTANASASPTSSQVSPTGTLLLQNGVISTHQVIACVQYCENKIRIELTTVQMISKQNATELKFTITNYGTIDFPSVSFSPILLEDPQQEQFPGTELDARSPKALPHGNSISMTVSFHLLLQSNVKYELFIALADGLGNIYYEPASLVI